MADLWDRLRAAQARGPGPVPEPGSAAPGDPAPGGWGWVSPLVAERSLVFPLEPTFWAAVSPEIRASDWDQVFCFDTETTGLSGGAGTVAFLVGWARLLSPDSPGGLPQVEVRQWFLRDHPGEPELVAAVDAALGPCRALVSFNGASFDLPLLKGRWALAGRDFPSLPHRDDLHLSRRLWKRLLESCRLSQIEESVLGIRRHDDVPGALVPALWFDYLRRGAAPDFAAPLEGVLRHHAQDVYSLLCLDLVLHALKENPNANRWVETFGPFPARPAAPSPAAAGLLHPDLGERTPVDFWGLADLRSVSDRDRSLEAAWDGRPDEALGLAWADRLKRQNDPRAPHIWARLWEDNRSFPALEELVKWLEHRQRTPEARQRALALVNEALGAPFLPRAWRLGLEKRRDRLDRRT